MKKLVNIKDLCARLQITRSTLTNWNKKFPDFPKCVRIGRENFYDLDEFEAWAKLRRSSSRTTVKTDRNKKRKYGVKFNQVSKFIKYWCVDSAGRAWFFENKPYITNDGFWNDDGFGYCLEAPIFEFDGDWKESLVER